MDNLTRQTRLTAMLAHLHQLKPMLDLAIERGHALSELIDRDGDYIRERHEAPTREFIEGLVDFYGSIPGPAFDAVRFAVLQV